MIAVAHLFDTTYVYIFFYTFLVCDFSFISSLSGADLSDFHLDPNNNSAQNKL